MEGERRRGREGEGGREREGDGRGWREGGREREREGGEGRKGERMCVWMNVSYGEWLSEWSPLFSEVSWAMVLVQIRGLLLMAMRRFRGPRKLLL